MTKYEKIVNVYDDGFSNLCSCCNEPYPTYSVKLDGENYSVQLNNKQFIRFFNSSKFKSVKYTTIKRVELDIDKNIITLHRCSFRVNVEFKSKKAKLIYDKLSHHMGSISTYS